MWKMRYDRRPILRVLCDKYLVRQYVTERVGVGVLPDLFQVATRPDEICWGGLPTSFVVKATHGSGWNLFVHDKQRADQRRIIAQCKSWIGRNYYHAKGEWAYRDLIPRILVEEMLCDDNGRSPMDYKFFCFDGKVRLLLVDIDRFGDHKKNFYSPEWQLIKGVKFGYDNSEHPIKRPCELSEMIEIAEKLSNGMDMVRVDLYNLEGRVVFGEMTNYPLAGARPFEPVDFDLTLGAMWKLPPRVAIRGEPSK